MTHEELVALRQGVQILCVGAWPGLKLPTGSRQPIIVAALRCAILLAVKGAGGAGLVFGLQVNHPWIQSG